MAEETATIEAPAEVDSGFGNISEAFDNVFRATKEDAPAAAPDAAPVTPTDIVNRAAPAAPAPAPAPAAAAPDEAPILPASIFGDEPAAPSAPVEKKEFDAPDKIKNDPKQYQSWNQVRGELETAESTVAKLTNEVSQWKEKAEKGVSDPEIQARLATLQRENEELSAKISTVDLQSHPAFQSRFVQGRNRLIDSATEIVKDAGIDPDVIKRALNMTGSAKIQALDDIVDGIRSPTLGGQLTKIVAEINDLDQEKSLAISNADTHLDALRRAEAEHRDRTVLDTNKRLNGMFDGIAKHLAEKKMPFFMKVDGDEAWNKGLEEDLNTARKIALESKDEVPLLGTIYMGVRAQKMQDAVIALYKRTKAQDALIAELRGAEPNLGGSRRQGEEIGAGDKNLSFAESVAQNSGLQ